MTEQSSKPLVIHATDGDSYFISRDCIESVASYTDSGRIRITFTSGNFLETLVPDIRTVVDDFAEVDRIDNQQPEPSEFLYIPRKDGGMTAIRRSLVDEIASEQDNSQLVIWTHESTKKDSWIETVRVHDANKIIRDFLEPLA